MSQNQVVEFITLLADEDYEILNQYPYIIRKKSNHYEIKEFNCGKGYIGVKLNRKSYLKHKLIAEQFIPNPDSLPYIDHINHDRTDYHIHNLRWVSASENNKNKSSNKGVEYTFVDEIDPESIDVLKYGDHEFEFYYYDETVDRFYFWNGMQFRELYINEAKNGLLYVNMYDTKGKKVNIYYSKFKKIHDLA